MRLLIKTQHTFHVTHVCRINLLGTAQLTLTLGSHLGEDMAFVSAFALDSGTGFLKPFRRAAMDFCFRHLMILRIYGNPTWAHTINNMKQLTLPPALREEPVIRFGKGLLLLFLDRCQDHGYLPTFHLGFLVDSAILLEIFPDALHHLCTELLVGHFTTAES